MHRITRFGRALLLVLMLPALLAPSSWAMRICFCEAIAVGLGISTPDCCQPSEPTSCCETGASDGLSTDHDCSECHTFDVGNTALQLTQTPSLPDAAPAVVVAWILPPPELIVLPISLRCVRGPAPPKIDSLLPLRI